LGNIFSCNFNGGYSTLLCVLKCMFLCFVDLYMGIVYPTISNTMAQNCVQMPIADVKLSCLKVLRSTWVLGVILDYPGTPIQHHLYSRFEDSYIWIVYSYWFGGQENQVLFLMKAGSADAAHFKKFIYILIVHMLLS
jgi:hypothetical protein